MRRLGLWLISITLSSGLLFACSGSSTAPSTTIAVTGTSTLGAPGQTSQLDATQSKSGTSTDVTNLSMWSSSDSTIVAVTNSGFTTAVAVGSAVVTATYQGTSGTLSMTVSPAAVVPPGPATYVYTGLPFTTFVPGLACPPTCQMTGQFTVSSQPAGSQMGVPLKGVQSYSFSDGRLTLTQANSTMTLATISTTAAGQLTPPWVFTIQSSTPSGMVEFWIDSQAATLGGASDGSAIAAGANGSAYNTATPGTWVQQ
jgi:hypothetical protein